MLNPQIFHEYDIRGIYADTLTDEDALLLGKALGTTMVHDNLRYAIVGADNRPSSPALKDAFIKGLTQSGISTMDLGTVTTPMVLFCANEFGADAGIVITASHNSSDYNGIKISRKGKPLSRADYLQLKVVAESADFTKGETQFEKYDIWPKYKESLVNNFKFSKKFNIKLDPGTGVCSLFASELFQSLGCNLSETPDFTLTFDTDGDRLGVLGKDGKQIPSDLIAAILFKGAPKVVLNVSILHSAAQYLKNNGTEISLSATGYPHMMDAMEKEEAEFGAEVSGHFFFKDKHQGYNDAFYAACRLLEVLDKSEKTLEELCAEIPTWNFTPEVHAPLPENFDKNTFLSGLVEEFSDTKQNTLDGVRFTYYDGAWGIIRLSNTEPLASARAEAKTPQRLEEIKIQIQSVLAKYQVQLQW
ncbi:MAG: hypothetical protein Q7S79_02440 [bacterium]|nr:hypothetical protein [bacterium]